MDVMVERHHVTVFFDRCGPSGLTDQRRVERALDNAATLASAEAAGGAPETRPLAA